MKILLIQENGRHDANRGEGVFENTFREGNYDVLLHATKDYVKQDHHLWFPNAVNDELIKPLDIEKEYDLGFCGNYVNRKPVLEFLEREHNLHLDIFVIGDAMVEAINKYKCHFNLNITKFLKSKLDECLKGNITSDPIVNKVIAKHIKRHKL